MLVVVLVEPPLDAAVPLTLNAGDPSGGVVSLTKWRTALSVLEALSLAVTV